MVSGFRNQYFSLDSNGTLRSATIFDFKTNSTTQPIRVESRMNTMEHSKVLSMLQLRMMDCMMERPKFLQFLEAREPVRFILSRMATARLRILIPLNYLGFNLHVC